MNGMRRAALTLHSLSDEDRQWVMDRLPAETSASVKALLDELAELGVSPQGPDIVMQVGESQKPAAGESPRFEEIGAWRLARVLEAEPAEVVHAVLGLPGAPPRPAMRSPVRERSASSHRHGPRFAASLRAAVEAAARQVPAGDGANAGAMRSARERMTRWFERVAAWK